MAGYKKFNFMFFILENYIHQITLCDAAPLNNFRVMIPCPVNGGGGVLFKPQRFPNNPSAFSDPATYSEWSDHFFNNDFPMKNPICFVFYEYFYTKLKPFNFFAYLRANYPDCKLVLWLDNPMHEVKSARKMFLDESDTKEILSTFDCVLTYNQVDAINYGLTYFEGPYSVLPFKQPKPVVDIFFVGQAKDRLEKILRAYERFTAQGFVCDFYVTDDITPPITKG